MDCGVNPVPRPLAPRLVPKIVSLNVNGLGSKYEQVRHQAEEYNWVVFGLQETLLWSSFAPCLGNFEVVSAARIYRPGERRVFLAVQKGLRFAVHHLARNFIIASITFPGVPIKNWFVTRYTFHASGQRMMPGLR